MNKVKAMNVVTYHQQRIKEAKRNIETYTWKLIEFKVELMEIKAMLKNEGETQSLNANLKRVLENIERTENLIGFHEARLQRLTA